MVVTCPPQSNGQGGHGRNGHGGYMGNVHWTMDMVNWFSIQLLPHSTGPQINWSSNQLVSLSVLGVLQTGEDCVTSVQKENMGF